MRLLNCVWRIVLPVFLIAALSVSCSAFKLPSQGFWEKRIEVEPMSRIVITYANKMRVEKSLRFEDSQVFYSDYAEVIQVIFSTQLILELRETRELMVDCVEGLLKELNNDPLVTSQFQAGMVKPENIELYIGFESYHNEYVDHMYMGWLSLIDGTVRYYAGGLKDFKKDYWYNRAEPYFKSVQFVTYDREARASYDAANTPQRNSFTVYDALIE